MKWWLFRLQARLMRRQYLSTACASGHCEACRLANKYTGQSCVCALCHHTPMSLIEGADCGPWVHQQGTELPQGFTPEDFEYRGEEYGVRKELVDDVIGEWVAIGAVVKGHEGEELVRETAWLAAERVLSRLSPRTGWTANYGAGRIREP